MATLKAKPNFFSEQEQELLALIFFGGAGAGAKAPAVEAPACIGLEQLGLLCKLRTDLKPP